MLEKQIVLVLDFVVKRKVSPFMKAQQTVREFAVEIHMILMEMERLGRTWLIRTLGVGE